MKTVGVVRRIEDRKVIEIAEPFGVVAAIVPSTNPTSTAIYKILISLKARCPIVISPHPAAVRCISRVAEVMNEAARRAGAPDGAISWMTTVTLEGTQELMKARETAVILATGGMGLVRAAYSAGKPAYGVGPGNAPAYIERTADVAKAVRDIVTGKTFDNGVLCSSENSVVVDAPLVEEVKRQFVANGAHFLSRGRDRRRRQGARQPAAAAQPGARRTARPRSSRSRPASPCRRRRACSSPSSPASAATIRCRSRSSARSSPSTSSPTGARAASAASRSSATAGWGTRCPSTRATTTSSCSSA